MKRIIREVITRRLHDLFAGELGELPYFEVEQPRNAGFGDWSTNVAMMLGKRLRIAPRELAGRFIDGFSDPFFTKVEVAGPGFINFFLDHGYLFSWIGNRTGLFFDDLKSPDGCRQRIHIEYVSANPTGPLHVGHARGAAIGSALARIHEAVGNEVHQEFYINDGGAQVRNLGISLLQRAREMRGETVELPPDGYHGEYVKELAAAYLAEDRPVDVTDENIAAASSWGSMQVLGWIRKDLADFAVRFDEFFSERRLYDEHLVDACIDEMRGKGLVRDADGALWFESSRFGDDKDRVLVKENGDRTYFAADIAYHRFKFQQGYDRYVNIWGSDHHGYVQRVKSSLRAMGFDEKKLDVVLVQMVRLFRGGQLVTMSKRTGDFVTMREVIDEVGSDAVRFVFLTRSCDSMLDFDVELVRKKASDNPVFYVQYMFARISSVFRVAEEKGVDLALPMADFAVLGTADERRLLQLLLSFPDVVALSAERMEPHQLAHYLLELAQAFHAYYTNCRFVDEAEPRLTHSRLKFLGLVRQAVERGLNLLGIDAPERM